MAVVKEWKYDNGTPFLVALHTAAETEFPDAIGTSPDPWTIGPK